MTAKTLRLFLSLIGFSTAALLISPVQAQTSVVRAGSFEVGAFAGASYGIDEARVMGGGNVTFAATKWLLPYAEFSYFPGIGRQIKGVFPNNNQPYTETFSIPITDFHGGVHIRIPIREKPI